LPSVQFTPTLVFTKAFGLLKGLAFDDSGVMSAVEVSLNGGAFKKALLGDGSVFINSPQAGEVTWSLPIDASNTDGDPLQVVARAVDAAGNVGPNSAPVMITMDTTGPTINVINAGTAINGTVFDGSGVSEVAISLDGGTTYQAAVLNGSNWSFNVATWAGGTPIAFVIIRARDVYGNESQTVDVSDVKHVYLPVVRR
jgi:hypothetical protein